MKYGLSRPAVGKSKPEAAIACCAVPMRLGAMQRLDAADLFET